jgi:hypothetical protein
VNPFRRDFSFAAYSELTLGLSKLIGLARPYSSASLRLRFRESPDGGALARLIVDLTKAAPGGWHEECCA